MLLLDGYPARLTLSETTPRGVSRTGGRGSELAVREMEQIFHMYVLPVLMKIPYLNKLQPRHLWAVTFPST